MLNKIKSYFSNLFTTVDKSAYNCEVFLHKESAELFVLNSEAQLEGNKDKIRISDLKSLGMKKNGKTVVMTLDRYKFEYLGQL